VDFTMPADESAAVDCVDEIIEEPTPPIITDNCGNVIPPPGPVVVTSPDPIECSGTVTYTWTYQDCVGNSHDWVFTYVVNDTTAPNIEVAASDAIVECDGLGNLDALAAWLENNGGATASDNCSTIVWSNDFDQLSDGCGETGSVTVNFTATDECGNVATTTATFTIEDTTVPVLLTEYESQLTVECEQDIPAAPVLEFEDSCSTNVEVTFEETSTYVDELTDYEITREWTVADDCGNEDVFVQTIFVESCGVLGVGFEIYNGVTPNGDGLNDFFWIEGIAPYPNNNVKIFNRWGVLVWETDGYNESDNVFRGESNGRATINAGELLPTGTYFYILTFTGGETPEGQNSYTGYLYINR